MTAVGYGNIRADKTRGPQNIQYDPVRRVATQSFLNLQPQWMFMNENPAGGNGGTCYGDLGGPHFIGDSEQVVSLSITVTRPAAPWRQRCASTPIRPGGSSPRKGCRCRSRGSGAPTGASRPDPSRAS